MPSLAPGVVEGVAGESSFGDGLVLLSAFHSMLGFRVTTCQDIGLPVAFAGALFEENGHLWAKDAALVALPEELFPK